jgi:hypothetical protein
VIPIIGGTPDFGLRHDVGTLVKREVKRLMLDAIGDQLFHAEIVAAGRFHFRAAFSKQMGPAFNKHRAPCDELSDTVYRFLEVQWKQRYPDISAEMFLDHVEIKKGPTPEEIEDAWEVEIGSSEDAMRMNWEGSARTRKGKDLGERYKPLLPTKH